MNASLDEIRKIGDPVLYRVAEAVEREEIPSLRPVFDRMHDLILEFRRVWGAGRAMAAPQVGVSRRFICLNIDRPLVLINPEITETSPEMMELWDNCMSFPHLLVKLRRHRTVTVRFHDQEWNRHEWKLEGDLSELLQHETDHLDGILATMRAIDNHSFRWREPMKTGTYEKMETENS
ncbi:MAG: peptide deformylase [Bacteroidales bacterium]